MGDKMKREFSTALFLSAFVLTLLIFIAGFIFGIFYTETINTHLIDKTQDISGSLNVLQFALLLENESFCDMTSYIIPRLEEESWKIGERLQYLEEQGKTDPQLKNTYFEYEYRDMLIVRKAIEECNYPTKQLIYFYTNEPGKCPKCHDQGFELSKAREKLKEMNISLRVYSFDGLLPGLGEYLAQRYNVTSFPTLIYENKSYGYMSAEEVIALVRG
ncbi:MAG: conjugal transfer protein TraF [Candidatus Micrarchaeota archaeon]|nr:conjugal transfer protein TraF [Candidatus Micrarchaeota archaeon]